MNALVLYYSYSGNTERIARQVSTALDCDLAETQTVTPYSDNYDERRAPDNHKKTQEGCCPLEFFYFVSLIASRGKSPAPSRLTGSFQAAFE